MGSIPIGAATKKQLRSHYGQRSFLFLLSFLIFVYFLFFISVLRFLFIVVASATLLVIPQGHIHAAAAETRQVQRHIIIAQLL